MDFSVIGLSLWLYNELEHRLSGFYLRASPASMLSYTLRVQVPNNPILTKTCTITTITQIPSTSLLGTWTLRDSQLQDHKPCSLSHKQLPWTLCHRHKVISQNCPNIRSWAPQIVVPLNRGTPYRPQYTIVLTTWTPRNGTPNFGKLPNFPSHTTPLQTV